jgi:acetyl-CoA acetyltransferase
MARPVYIAGVGLTKVDLTGRVFGSVFDLFAEAFEKALADSRVRSFGAVQVGIMDSEEFENRANIAATLADRLGLRGVPAVRTETASSTGAAAFHEACHKVAAGACESVLVLAGERMKTVTTEVATAIMSKTVDPAERRFGFTMPGLIALVTRAWMRAQGIEARRGREILSRLMWRAHALGAENPLAAFHGRPEPLAAYFDPAKNLPVATPLTRKDCSPICDGAAAVIVTARPHGVRVAGLGSATESSSVLDRAALDHLDATRLAASKAYFQAGIARPRTLEGLVVEAHDAFNSLLPIDLADLGLAEPAEAVAALVGDLAAPPRDPLSHPVSGVSGRLPVNLSGGLKARGHPVGGTGLFQIAECALQLLERFPNPRAQVARARIGLAHSIGGPGNNVYVTLLERADSRRRPEPVAPPRLVFGRRADFARLPRGRASRGLAAHRAAPGLHGASGEVLAATTIHVAAGPSAGPIPVAVVQVDGQRHLARLDPEAAADAPPEDQLAGQRVRLFLGPDGIACFRPEAGPALVRWADRVREMLG